MSLLRKLVSGLSSLLNRYDYGLLLTRSVFLGVRVSGLRPKLREGRGGTSIYVSSSCSEDNENSIAKFGMTIQKKNTLFTKTTT